MESCFLKIVTLRFEGAIFHPTLFSIAYTTSATTIVMLSFCLFSEKLYKSKYYNAQQWYHCGFIRVNFCVEIDRKLLFDRFTTALDGFIETFSYKINFCDNVLHGSFYNKSYDASMNNILFEL